MHPNLKHHQNQVLHNSNSNHLYNLPFQHRHHNLIHIYFQINQGNGYHYCGFMTDEKRTSGDAKDSTYEVVCTVVGTSGYTPPGSYRVYLTEVKDLWGNSADLYSFTEDFTVTNFVVEEEYPLLEETYEVIEAIENHNMNALKEELGDLMLHIIFYSKKTKLILLQVKVNYVHPLK